MVPLPSLPQLLKRCQALAALDLILSPEWEYRYYSFNSRWSPQQMMASMRDGSGDEWWIVFHKSGWAGLKGFGHESAAWSKYRLKLSQALQKTMPASLEGFGAEPAFRWDSTSFAYFHSPDGTWSRCNDLTKYRTEANTGEVELLALLVGTPADYVRFAADYFETEVEEDIVSSIFAQSAHHSGSRGDAPG